MELSILLVEDSDLDAELVATSLAAGGIDCKLERVDRQETYLAALENGRFDAILSDVSLPRFDGATALLLAAKLRPEIPFVFVSGAIGEERAIGLLKAGATDYVLKQHLERLVPALRRALREAEAQAERRRAEGALRFLASASSAMAGLLEPEATAARVAELAVPYLADACAVVAEAAPGRPILRVWAPEHPEWAEPLGEAARAVPELGLEEGTPVLLRTTCLETSPAMRGLQQAGASALLVIPLGAGSRAAGALLLASATGPERFGPARRAVAEEFARRAAVELDAARLHEALRVADRRKDEFLAMLAHELRNPLAPILSAAELVRLQGRGDERLSRAAAVIDRQARHMSRLVDDLLDVSRITRGRIELRQRPLELRSVVEGALEACAPILDRHGHRVEVSLPAEPVALEGDPNRLEQVLCNLLHNAAKYTDRGGRIAVSAAVERGEVVLRVRDTGVGIEPSRLPEVFEPFLQVDPTPDRGRGGLGLGLTLVRMLTQLHGGSVAAHSEGRGKGSEFTVRLPLRGIELPRAREPVREETAPSRRVLVVEDNADARIFLQDLLEQWGHQVDVADDGERGLVLALSQRYDLALVDIGLPGIEGYEVARRIRAAEEKEGLRRLLVALTGYGTAEDRRKALDAGFDAHWVKPLEMNLLSNCLQTLQVRGARR